jgi:hypothetical protein
MRALVLACGTCALLVSACGPSSKTGDCKDSLIAGDLVITEVFADYKAAAGGTGADEGKEWFEIYNAADRPVDLEGLTITHSRPDGSKAKTHVMDAITLAPGQYFTLGNSTPDLVPAYVDYGYSADLGDFFNADGGKLALACGSGEIDSATYELVKEGHSRQLTANQAPDYTLNDDLAQWCEAADSEFETGNFGTPGSDNDCTPVVVGQCNDGGVSRPTVAPLAGELVITEAMPSPSKVSDTTGEWFEVKALADVDLNGLGLDRAGDTGVNPDLVDSPDCLHVTAGSYVVFAKSTDPVMNGGLPGPIAGTFKFSSVAGSVTAPGDIQILSGATVIDAISWTKSTTGKSLQLDPDFEDAVANDQLSNYCDGTAPYGAGDLGTPGTINGQCTLLPQPGQCSDNGVNRAIVKPTPGQLVINEFLANPAGTATDATQEWFEIANTGATAFDLNELGLKGNATTINVIQSADCKSVLPGGFALFAHNTDPLQNGGLPVVDATFTFALAATSGSLHVLDGATELDAITWPASPAVPDGVSRQLNPLNATTTDNDDPANFCNSTAAQTYGTAANFGTPKALNVCL